MNILTIYHSRGHINGYIPNWVCFTSAFLYTSYHLLDLCDGKHARRIGMSSALGMLMDHGCDAVTCTLLSVSLGAIVNFRKHFIKIETPMEYVMLWLVLNFQFFLCTWEEFHLNTLDLPCLNGVNEGTIIVSVSMILSGIFGIDFWINRVYLFGSFYRYNQIILYLVCLTGIPFMIYRYDKLNHSYSNVLRTNHIPKLKAFLNTTIYFYLIYSLLIVIEYSKSELIQNYPIIILYTFGFAAAKIVVN
jgi:ethanolaminephosphotransferase